MMNAPKKYSHDRTLFKLVFLIGVFLFTVTANAEVDLFGKAKTTEKVNIQTLSESELESYMATLTDKESRELLLQQLKIQAEEEELEESDRSFSAEVIMSLQDGTEVVEGQLRKIISAKGQYSQSVSRTLTILFNVDGIQAIPKTVATLIALILLGWLAVTLVFWVWQDFRNRLRQAGDFTVSTSLSRIGIGLLHDLLQIALFVTITISLTFVFFDKLDPVRVLASTIVILVASLWAANTLLTELLYSPIAKNLFFTDDIDRKIYYRASMGFFIASFISMYSSGFLRLLGFPFPLVRLNGLILATLGLGSLIIGVVVVARRHSKRLTALIEAKPDRPHYINWYWPFVLIFLLLWVSALHNILTVREIPSGRFNYFAVILIMLFPLYDRLIQLLMSPQVFVANIQQAPQSIMEADLSEGEGASVPGNQFVRLFFAIPYVALILLCAVEGMGFSVLSRLEGDLGANFWKSIIEVVLAIFLGGVLWNAVKTYINKNLPEISVDPEALMDSEGGGSDVATRTQTLLPIIRNFFLFIIILTVALIVLSALGVNTAPLLAGAGVVGIAIGFGAQKLVQDIVSGMFFLIEDAFRIGEYIESDALVGTVESTSIRSLKLRHHLGPVQTVPYSEIRSVKNHSRDFIIMKLKFRVPFDTDIEVVRKTIKKVGQELLKHEELGPDFIAPLKSQGVLHIEDDALMMRMKFTSKPGKQWVIRREAYRLVKEALEAKGINFAQRQVTVHIPDSQALDEAQRRKIVGAAAESSEPTPVKKDQPIDPMADM